MENKDYGTEKAAIDSIRLNDRLTATKKDGGETATIQYTFKGTINEARRAAPALGSFSDLLPKTLQLCERTFNGEDASVTVTLSYAELTATSESVQIGTFVSKYKLSSEQNVASVLNNPKYKNASEEVLTAAKAYLDGVNDDDTINGKTWKQLLKDKKIYNNTLLVAIRKGETQYRYSSYTWEVTAQASGPKAATHKLNQTVSNPPGPAPSAPDGMEWVVNKLNADKNTGDANWTITTTYKTLPKQITTKSPSEAQQ